MCRELDKYENLGTNFMGSRASKIWGRKNVKIQRDFGQL